MEDHEFYYELFKEPLRINGKICGVIRPMVHWIGIFHMGYIFEATHYKPINKPKKCYASSLHAVQEIAYREKLFASWLDVMRGNIS